MSVEVIIHERCKEPVNTGFPTMSDCSSPVYTPCNMKLNFNEFKGEHDMNLTRQQYKTIKNSNRDEMEGFLSRFHTEAYNSGYNAGYQAGVEASATTSCKLLLEKVEAGIKATSGIGQKRFDDLMANIAAELNKSEVKENDTEASPAENAELG